MVHFLSQGKRNPGLLLNGTLITSLKPQKIQIRHAVAMCKDYSKLFLAKLTDPLKFQQHY